MGRTRAGILGLVVAGALAALGMDGPTRPGAAERPLATTETLLGAWNGHWLSEDRERRGPLGLVLARTPGQHQVLGHFSFVTGAVTRSLRYAGRIDNGRVEFPLVGEGRIVLEPVDDIRLGTAARLHGEWTDARGALPAPRGVIELSRAN
jgi:hypothetical protein